MNDERLSECCGEPALGELSDDDFGVCAGCKEHAEFLPACPECDSGSVAREKFSGAGAIPAARVLKCQDCGHEWGHA